jgi:hypothetical protein
VGAQPAPADDHQRKAEEYFSVTPRPLASEPRQAAAFKYKAALMKTWKVADLRKQVCLLEEHP